MKGLFITATDTDAGKTYVTALLLRVLREMGVNAIGYKPVACGDRQDARLIREEMPDKNMSLGLINPVYFKNSTAPYVASLLEGEAVNMNLMTSGYDSLVESYEAVLVEGVGGWETPLSKGVLMSDYVEGLGLPVLLVLDNKLGMLNHAKLTVNAIQQRGLNCIGVVMNNKQVEWTTAHLTNRQVIEELLGVPVLGELISEQDFLDADPIWEAWKNAVVQG